jgi:glycosyltransferase involved in cell wall biosynthesis
LKKNSCDEVSVTLLTGGGDRPYAFGLATALVAQGVAFDFIGSDNLDFPELHGLESVRLLNLQGDQRSSADILRKVRRVLTYYAKLLRYAYLARPKLFHILWNNKFEIFDRTLLMLYYLCLRKKIVLTAHNVNTARRDSKDSTLNRLSLKIQYRLADHIFVHTEKMKAELLGEYDVDCTRVTVIPFGINNSLPNTSLTPAEAKKQLGIKFDEKAILFFGNITPYKGLEYLVSAFRLLQMRNPCYRLIIAGRPKDCGEYWSKIREILRDDIQKGRAVVRDEFIPDDETEIYFKAADVFVLPYRQIDQSGVLFLGYSFGLPVVAADVGSMKDDILEGKTGFMCQPEDSEDLAVAIERYFGSDLYANLNARRQEIRHRVKQRNSWDVVGRTTLKVYTALLQPSPHRVLVSS